MPVYRSFLFAPGNHPRRVEKCLTLSTDAVILDLEDAVAQNEKEATRAVVVQALSQPRRCQAYVRVNALSTPWSYGDIEAVVVAGLDGIVLPKVESAADLLTAEWMISALERARGLTPGAIDLMPIIETAKGYVALESIVRSGTRVKRVAFGAGDFTLDEKSRQVFTEGYKGRETGHHSKGAFTVKVVTLFPEAFPGTLGLSLTGTHVTAWTREAGR